MTTGAHPEGQGQAIRRPQRLGDEVHAALYGQLMSLRTPPGARMSVDSLARDMGVSQTPVREALSRLEAQGLVVKTHLVGYSAAPQIDEARLGQLYDLRLLLEPFAAREAARAMGEAERAQLRALDEGMREVQAGGREGYGTFAIQDGQFHDLVAQGSGNALVRDALARLHTHIHLFRLFYLASATQAANGEHARIVGAIERRDPEAAEAAMRAHVQASRERFMRAAP